MGLDAAPQFIAQGIVRLVEPSHQQEPGGRRGLEYLVERINQLRNALSRVNLPTNPITGVSGAIRSCLRIRSGPGEKRWISTPWLLPLPIRRSFSGGPTRRDSAFARRLRLLQTT